MAEKVAEVIEGKRHLVVEAGTGTGKSLAYLVPAAYAAESGRKAIVSTYTIHLQEQLFGKIYRKGCGKLSKRTPGRS